MKLLKYSKPAPVTESWNQTSKTNQLYASYKKLDRQSLPSIWVQSKCVITDRTTTTLHRLLVVPLTWEQFSQTGLPKMAALLPSSWWESIISHWGRLTACCASPVAEGWKLAEVSCQMLDNTHNHRGQREISSLLSGSCWRALLQTREHQSHWQPGEKGFDHHFVFSHCGLFSLKLYLTLIPTTKYIFLSYKTTFFHFLTA